MDTQKIGALIRSLRQNQGLTQLQLADALHISDKTVSKWERGMGCPDISMFHTLSEIFGVDTASLLQGDLSLKQNDGGNMKKTLFYHCPHCGNLLTATTKASISCCGYTLTPCTAKKADDTHHITIEDCGDEWYITAKHPMQKDHYLSCIAYRTIDRMLTVKLYPEQEIHLYLPKMRGGSFLLLCSKDGLFEQR